MADAGSILGNAVVRREDPGLLTGHNKYFDDLHLDGEACIAFVRSPIAHGTIESIEVGDAPTMPGVIAVYTSDNTDLSKHKGFAMMPDSMDRPPLAKGKVRFVGDIIAAVVAETLAQAMDAAAEIYADIEPLDAVLDLWGAAGAPKLFDGTDSNVCFATTFPAEGYDAFDPMAGAETVVETTFVSQRLAGAPMENGGCVAVPNEPATGSLTLWVSHQNPHAVQPQLAGFLGLEADQVRVATPWVGGGFGPKAAVVVEYLLAAYAAQQLQRPVKWTELRSENMVAMVHGRAMEMKARLGVTNTGKFVGLDVDVVADAGAYPMLGAVLPMLTQQLIPGVYEFENIKFRAHSLVTNTTPTAAYRGAGRPEATQVVERLVDIAADAIDMDPAEIRRVNYLPADSYPLTTPTGSNYDSGDHHAALERALQNAGYDEMRAEQQRRRQAGDTKQIGIGVASYVEVTAPLGLHVEYSKVEINPDGTATMYVGTSSHGQGHETAFSMIVSDRLGIPMDKINFVDSDTMLVKRGQGTAGSRSLQTAGAGVYVASDEVLAKAKRLAAHLLEANVDDIDKAQGGLGVAGVPTSTLSWSELAAAAADPARLPEGMEPGLAFEHDYDEGDATYPFGSHVSMVEVDMETGGVQILRHVAVDDCGTILNPLLVTGQQHGGIAQGLAQVLFEHVSYDEFGNPQNATLMDYLVPSAAELVSFETDNTETASPRNALGAKGIGESGTIGSTPALHNAVIDAVSHLGIVDIAMPCTPQKVWQAIQTASA